MSIDRQPPAAALSRLPPECPPGGRGWCAAAASILEATAPKPGNVHPGASFADLDYDDLVAAGLAIAPAIEQAARQPLGRTILAAVRASRAVTRSNANLGIVLLIAPLAAADTPRDVDRVLERLTVADAADVWQAIAEAMPGGMGTSNRDDLRGPAPTDLRQAMRLAAPHDTIARLWAEGYADLLAGPVRDLAAGLAAGLPLLDAIVCCQLHQLAREPDTLIARRHGTAAAKDVSRAAADVLAVGGDWREAVVRFDVTLRTPRRLNPGTTADLIAAALYILLREGKLPSDRVGRVTIPMSPVAPPPPPQP
jgi:triphosphoribosyl-dephospho-CoA synthase